MSTEPDTRALDALIGFFETRAPKKESPHTTRAYRNDLTALMGVVADQLGKTTSDLTVDDLADLRTMRRAFGWWVTNGPQGQKRADLSIKRAHSTWSVFFEYLVSEELVTGSPMAGIGKPKKPRTEPKPLTREAAARVVRAVQDGTVKHRDPWPELDAAIILFDLVTGARTSEMLGADIGHVTREPGNESVRLLGKGGHWRVTPLEPALLDVLARYLDSRRARFPDSARTRGMREDAGAWDWWRPADPLFVDRRGARMPEGALRYLVKAVYRAANVNAERARGAMTHALRHTAASRLAESGATVVDLMKMFGWQSLSTPQHYIDTTGREVREAARGNPVYDMLTSRDGPTPDDILGPPPS